MNLFDSHCHLNDEKFNIDREEVINDIYSSGVTKLVNAGYDIPSSKSAVLLAKKHEFIYATVRNIAK